MKFRNNQKRAVTTTIGVFILIVLFITFFIDSETRVYYYLVLSVGIASALFRLHNGKKVKKISLQEGHIIALLYDKPFVLQKKTFTLASLNWFWSNELVGQLATANKLVGKSKDDKIAIVLSEELLLWKKSQIDEVVNALQEEGVSIKGFSKAKS